MKHKALSIILILVTLFSCCEILKNNVDALSPPLLTGNYEKNIITNDNAILNVELKNLDRKNIDAFEIVIKCENVEIVKYQKKINDDSNRIYATFDIKKDTGKKLDSGKEYEYTITAVSSESFNESMYTIRDRFVTNNVNVVSTVKEKGHNTTTQHKKSATYFVKGYSGDTYCNTCKKVVKKGKTVAKKTLKKPTVKVTAGKKQIKVKYTKVSGATGFQVQYRKGKKTVTKNFSTKKSATKTIKKLAKGRYKVKVRAFVKSGTNKAYSVWTKTYSIKIK